MNLTYLLLNICNNKLIIIFEDHLKKLFFMSYNNSLFEENILSSKLNKIIDDDLNNKDYIYSNDAKCEYIKLLRTELKNVQYNNNNIARKLSRSTFKCILPTNNEYIISNICVCVKYENNLLECDCDICYYDGETRMYLHTENFYYLSNEKMFKNIVCDDKIFKNYLVVKQFSFLNIITSSDSCIDVSFCTELKFINDFDVYIKMRKKQNEYYPIYIGIYSIFPWKNRNFVENNRNKFNYVLFCGMIISVRDIIDDFITIKFKNEIIKLCTSTLECLDKEYNVYFLPFININGFNKLQDLIINLKKIKKYILKNKNIKLHEINNELSNKSCYSDPNFVNLFIENEDPNILFRNFIYICNIKK